MSYTEIVRTLKEFLTPLAKENIFNFAYTAGNDFIASDITPTRNPTLLRVHICLDTAGVFFCRRATNGVYVVENFNDGNNLTANSAYMFDTMLEGGEKINFRFSANAQILHFSVVEIPMVS